MSATPSEQALQDILSLVGIFATVEELQTLSADEQKECAEWCAAEHVSASDNPAHGKPRPDCMKRLRRIEADDTVVMPVRRRPNRKKVLTTVYLTPAQSEALRSLSKQSGVSAAEFMRRGVVAVLTRHGFKGVSNG